MPKRVLPTKRNAVKQSLMQGKSIYKALTDNNYDEGTARKGRAVKVVQEALEEIQKDFDKSKITPEFVLAGLIKEIDLALNAGDRIRAYELIGKYLAMFTDKTQNKTDITISQEDQAIIDKYKPTNRIDTKIDTRLSIDIQDNNIDNTI